MIASELSRAYHLSEKGQSPELTGCLQRARELLGVLESSPAVPREAVGLLSHAGHVLMEKRLSEAPAQAHALYQQLMALYAGGNSPKQ
jgi:hypothetical protein